MFVCFWTLFYNTVCQFLIIGISRCCFFVPRRFSQRADVDSATLLPRAVYVMRLRYLRSLVLHAEEKHGKTDVFSLKNMLFTVRNTLELHVERSKNLFNRIHRIMRRKLITDPPPRSNTPKTRYSLGLKDFSAMLILKVMSKTPLLLMTGSVV